MKVAREEIPCILEQPLQEERENRRRRKELTFLSAFNKVSKMFILALGQTKLGAMHSADTDVVVIVPENDKTVVFQRDETFSRRAA